MIDETERRRDRLFRQPEVPEKIGMGKSKLNDMIAGGSLPKPARIGSLV